ncbi:galactarate dehydratase [Burkholderia sp. lig30]|jgi:galactarate dehydratase|uniref:galactarate dehydratase n=1 Tax=Burkholderia sp. lig30 TaxID=1192124 RepID=UPI0004611579|nr:galactarate dehydratase [Burkholderia sp. lig30]KDB07571.1 galactarate dehydratase [Burkholderia sp. lig30]
MEQPPLYIRVHPDDNVAIVVNDGGLGEGATFPDGLVLRERVPQGHKVALRDLAEGDAVVRYGVVIGHALEGLPAGSWVNEHVMRMPAPPDLGELPIATIRPPAMPPLEGYTFDGYRNADGSVGTRNILAITTTVQCVADVVRHAVTRIKSELLPKFPHVDDVVSLGHTYGCGVAIDAPDAIVPIRTVRNIALNPNFGGEVMMVSLGCEKLQPERLMPRGTIPVAAANAIDGDGAAGSNGNVVVLQDESHVGFQSMIASIMQMAERHLERLNARRRETCAASALVVGVQCGGSDAFSGLTANPAVGFAADLLVRAGATVMFSEVTEVRDGVAQLTGRAANADVAEAIIREMAWYDAYLKRGGADRSANTTPGNKKGGLSNIVEKAMGSIVKSGSAPISGVLSPGEKVTQKGLIYAATPASDFICGTLQVAAGMNLHVFTTGRGTPYSLAEVPVIKVATRSDLARRWHDLMDLDAGTIATGAATIEDVGWALFRLMLDIASGRKQSCAEKLGLHNALALFNPAPVT